MMFVTSIIVYTLINDHDLIPSNIMKLLALLDFSFIGMINKFSYPSLLDKRARTLNTSSP